MRQAILLLFFLVASTTIIGQDRREQFVKHLQAGDTTAQLALLNRWEQEDPENAELFTCYFNYYVARSRQEVLSLTQEQPEGESFSFQDSTGKTAGYRQ